MWYLLLERETLSVDMLFVFFVKECLCNLELCWKKSFKEPEMFRGAALHVNYCMELYVVVQFMALLRILSLTLTVERKMLWLLLQITVNTQMRQN